MKIRFTALVICFTLFTCCICGCVSGTDTQASSAESLENMTVPTASTTSIPSAPSATVPHDPISKNTKPTLGDSEGNNLPAWKNTFSTRDYEAYLLFAATMIEIDEKFVTYEMLSPIDTFVWFFYDYDYPIQYHYTLGDLLVYIDYIYENPYDDLASIGYTELDLSAVVGGNMGNIQQTRASYMIYRDGILFIYDWNGHLMTIEFVINDTLISVHDAVLLREYANRETDSVIRDLLSLDQEIFASALTHIEETFGGTIDTAWYEDR